MMNHITHDYVPMELPNILMQEDKGCFIQTVIHPFMHPLIFRLARNRPNWRLVCTHRRHSSGENPTSFGIRFDVYEGDELLGNIRKDYNNRSGDVVAFNNHRLTKARARGDATRTKDMNKAYRIITKEFGRKTTSEIVYESYDTAIANITHKISTLQREYRYGLIRVDDAIKSFAFANFAEFRDFALGMGTAADRIDTLPDLRADAGYADAIEAIVKAEKGFVLVIRDSDYLVRTKDDTQVLDTDQITPHMKRCLGILKLCDVDQLIPGIGYKVSDNTFFIVPEEEQQP